MAEETTISTPTETADVDTSTTVEPTDVDTSTVEPTSNVDVAETETQNAEVQEERLYAGKYKSIEELEKGYSEAQKFVTKANDIEKKYNELLQAQQTKQDELYKTQLEQAKANGFNSIEAQQISQQVAKAEFDAYWQYQNQLPPEYQADVNGYLQNYYQTGDTRYLEEAKRYFDSGFIEKIALAKSQYEAQLKDQFKTQRTQQEEKRMQELATTLKADFGEFLTELEQDSAGEEALKAFCATGCINSKADMQKFQEIYSGIVKFAKEQAIKEYEAQKAIEATKEKAVIDTGLNATTSNDVLPTLEQIQAMSRDEYAEAVEKYGRDRLLNIN